MGQADDFLMPQVCCSMKAPVDKIGCVGLSSDKSLFPKTDRRQPLAGGGGL